MRTTLRIDDQLIRDLKEGAQRAGLSMTKFVDHVLRRGLSAEQQAARPTRPYREKTFRMGTAKVDLVKALALAAALEDHEVREELSRRK